MCLSDLVCRHEAQALCRTCKLLSGGSLVAKALLVAIGSVSDKDEVGEPESARVAGCEGEGMRWGFG
jgi:hypothetical protein